jgi:hypothetical protein
MEKLSRFTTSQLEQELENRKRALNERPKPKEDIDFEKLINMTENFVTNVIKGENRSDDDIYIWEKTMMTIYGDDFFNWFNENNKRG